MLVVNPLFPTLPSRECEPEHRLRTARPRGDRVHNPRPTITQKRQQLGIPPFGAFLQWTDEKIALLGTATDRSEGAW